MTALPMPSHAETADSQPQGFADLLRTAVAWVTLPAARIIIRHQERGWWEEQHWRHSRLHGVDIPEQVLFRDSLRRARQITGQAVGAASAAVLLPLLATPVQAAVTIGVAGLSVPVVVAVRGGRRLRRDSKVVEHDQPSTPMSIRPAPEFAEEDRRLRAMASVPPEVLDRLIAEYEMGEAA